MYGPPWPMQEPPTSPYNSNNLLNHNGDIFAAMKDLGSKKTIQSTLMAMGQSGASYGVLDELGIPKTSTEFSDRLNRSAVQTGMTTARRMAECDLKPSGALLQFMANTAGSYGGAQFANILGEWLKDGIVTELQHKFLHGVNSFGEGALSDLKHPLAEGAAGAVVAETLVGFLPDSFSPDQKMAVGQFGSLMPHFNISSPFPTC